MRSVEELATFMHGWLLPGTVVIRWTGCCTTVAGAEEDWGVGGWGGQGDWDSGGGGGNGEQVMIFVSNEAAHVELQCQSVYGRQRQRRQRRNNEINRPLAISAAAL